MVHSHRGTRPRCYIALVTWKESFFFPVSVPLRVCRCDYVKVLRGADLALSPLSCVVQEQTERKDRKPVDIMSYLDTSCITKTCLQPVCVCELQPLSK